MPVPKNTIALYNDLKTKYNDVGSLDDFVKYLSNDKNREALRKDLSKRYNDVGDISDFSTYLGFGTGEEEYNRVMDIQPSTSSPLLGGTVGRVFNTARQIIGNATAQPQQPATPVSTTQPATAQPHGTRVPRTLTPEEQREADRINAKAAAPRAPMSSYGQQVAEQRRRQDVGKYDKQVQPYDLSQGLGYTYSKGYNPEIREEPSAGSNNISNEQLKDRQELDAPLQERFRNNVLGILNEPEMKDALERAAEEVWKESKERAYKEENYSLSNNRANTARTRNASPSVNKEYLYEKFIQGWNNHTGDKTVGMNLERRIYEELVNRYPSELYPDVSNSMLHEEAENIVKNLMYETMYTKLYE